MAAAAGDDDLKALCAFCDKLSDASAEKLYAYKPYAYPRRATTEKEQHREKLEDEILCQRLVVATAKKARREELEAACRDPPLTPPAASVEEVKHDANSKDVADIVRMFSKHGTPDSWYMRLVVCEPSDQDSIEQVFKRFSTQHSWYKHLVGEVEFHVVPCKEHGWVLSYDSRWIASQLRRKPALIRQAIVNNTVKLTPFVYADGDDLGFHHALGNWGWPMLDWLDRQGYSREAQYVRSKSTDNAKDKHYKVLWRGSISANDEPILAQLYRAEYGRMLQNVKTASQNIARAFAVHLSQQTPKAKK